MSIHYLKKGDVGVLDEILGRPRVAILGGPKAGKTTLAMRAAAGRDVLHTDDYLGLPWSVAPGVIAEDLAGRGSFVLEGVRAAGALRRGVEVDAVVYVVGSHEPRSQANHAAARSVESSFQRWHAEAGDVPIYVVAAASLRDEP